MKKLLECDVLVIGSGAGGMLAATRAHDLGLNTVLVEKTDRYGGTSALSGGGVWIPNNDSIKDEDSPGKALEYLKACTKDRVAEDKLQAYIDNAPELLKYLEQLGIQYYPVSTYPDYNPWLPGALEGGRTLMPCPRDGRPLGDELFKLREPHPTHKLFWRMQMDTPEVGALIQRPRGWLRTVTRMMLRYWLDLPFRVRSQRDRRLAMGNALIGGLRLAMLERDIPLLLKRRLVSLEAKDNRVTGAVVSHLGKEERIAVRHAVIVASGGFEKNQELRDKHLRHSTPVDYSLTPGLNNSGDALQAGIEIGADTEFLEQAWWVPVMRVPAPVFNNADMRAGLFMERAFPHTMCVNRDGVRFANEAQSYNEFGQEMIDDDRRTGSNLPCWIIFDAKARHRYPIGALLPSIIWPDWRLPKEWLDNVVYRGRTVAELADKIGIDPSALESTVERFNGFARNGRDEDFGRGDNAYDRFYGDPRNSPNPNLGPISEAPFYAMQLDLGDIGTKGGLKTNADANVVRADGVPIAGLYATGNVSGAVTFDSYPGAGATLGPAMTFAFVAANHIAARATNRRSSDRGTSAGSNALG